MNHEFFLSLCGISLPSLRAKNAKLPTCNQRVIWYSQNEQRFSSFFFNAARLVTSPALRTPVAYFELQKFWGGRSHGGVCVPCFFWEKPNFQENLAMIRNFADGPSVSFRVLFDVGRMFAKDGYDAHRPDSVLYESIPIRFATWQMLRQDIVEQSAYQVWPTHLSIHWLQHILKLKRM